MVRHLTPGEQADQEARRREWQLALCVQALAEAAAQCGHLSRTTGDVQRHLALRVLRTAREISGELGRADEYTAALELVNERLVKLDDAAARVGTPTGLNADDWGELERDIHDGIFDAEIPL